MLAGQIKLRDITRRQSDFKYMYVGNSHKHENSRDGRPHWDTYLDIGRHFGQEKRGEDGVLGFISEKGPFRGS